MNNIVQYLKPPSIPVQWRRPLLLLAVALVALLGTYHDTVAETAHIWWRSETYAHGMLIIPFTLYMLWTHRGHLASLRPQMSVWGVAAMIPGVLGWLVGNAASAMVIQQLALLWLIWSVTLAVFGPRLMREMLFPMAYLFFAVPLGEGLIPLLMDFTAVFTINALILTGIPVYQEGLYFTIPSGSFEVAKACSGVRYLFASVALGGLFAYINYRSYWRRAIFIGIAILLPIIANGLRAYGIVILAHLSDMQIAVGFDHLIYGWLFFGLIMFVLFFIGAKWREDWAAPQSAQPAMVEGSPGATRYIRPGVSGALVLLLLVSPMVQAMMQGTADATQSDIELKAPPGQGGWHSTDASTVDWRVKFHGATAQRMVTYRRDEAAVHLFMAFYKNETQDRELINAINDFYHIKTWTRTDVAQRTLTLAGGHTVNIRQETLKSGGARRVVWYWYDIGGSTLTDIYLGKLLQAWHRLSGQARGDAAVALMVEIHDEQRAQAVATLESFIQSMYPGIEAEISRFRGDGE